MIGYVRGQMGVFDEIRLQLLVHGLGYLPVPMCCVLRYILTILPSTGGFLNKVMSQGSVLLCIRTLLQFRRAMVRVRFAEEFVTVCTDEYAKRLRPGEFLSIMVI
jgi:hypothetical protein